MENDLKSTAAEFTETFIGASTFEDTTICDDLIEYFERNPHLFYPGRLPKGVDLTVKNSFDANLNHEPYLNTRYIKELMKVINLYKIHYEYCANDDSVDTWGLTDAPQFQKYLPNGGFYKYHCERAGIKFGNRHLVYMTYLNDVHDGGETEFFYQKVKIKPRKGLTLIWPTDWTHTHRGIPSPSETKYIVTGWFHFV